MIARQKVVPPVTPRIVQAHTKQRLIRYVMLVCLFLLTAWFSYDYGRSQAPANGNAPVAQSRESESEQRIAELEHERDALKQQVAELEQSAEQLNQTLEVTQARIQTLQHAKFSQGKFSESTSETAAIVAIEPETPNNALKLENVRIIPTKSQNVYNIGFSVMREGDSSGRVTGTIWIAVNGFTDKKPKRLSFKMVSPDRRSYVKMGFDRQQDVTEEVVLPEGFRPKNVQIEVKPYGDAYPGTSEKFTWVTS